jgi:hypothetical protein
MVQRVFEGIASAINGGVKKSIHVLFHSAGGTVGFTDMSLFQLSFPGRSARRASTATNGTISNSRPPISPLTERRTRLAWVQAQRSSSLSLLLRGIARLHRQDSL